MKYQIASETTGRIRVRYGRYAFTQEAEAQIMSYFQELCYIEQVQVSYLTGSVLLRFDPSCRQIVLEELRDLDIRALPAAASKLVPANQTETAFRRQLYRLLTRRFLTKYLLPSPVSTLICLRDSCRYLREGLKLLLKGNVKVEILDGAAIGVSLLQGNFSTASSIIFFLKLSDLLEDYTRKKTKEALTENLILHVDYVWLASQGTEKRIPISRLSVGDQICIRTGSMIPVDGTITAGEASINESMMTGEPLPAFKKSGDSVFAGTVVQEGRITVEVRLLQSDSRIQQIVELIDQSETLKAGVQGKAERIADNIVPFSFLLSAGVMVFTGNWRKAVSVLLIDYSCALKLATPIAVISAMREAAAHQVMVKGGKYLEAMAEADTVVFDKTGTLTVADPQVSKVVAFDGFERNEVLRISACLEEHFPHSVARAIVEQALREELAHEEMHTEVEYIVAHGVATTIDAKRAIIGSEHFVFEDEQVPYTDAMKALVEAEAAGDSVIFLAIDQQAAGFICITDPPRKEAARIIQGLKKMGIQHTVMLTGDRDATAARISTQLGIDAYRSQVLPADKASIIKELQAQGHKIIMVGDGINDSPALSAADVSIAMKDSSDIAREVADITLLSSDLESLLMLRKLSKEMMRRIHQNFGIIITFNTALLFLGLSGIITTNTSAVMHNLSTMTISGASMRNFLHENIHENNEPGGGQSRR